MRLEAIKVFCDLASMRSFSRAAAANGWSQPKVSRVIQELEDRLQGQLELFRRMQLWMASFWQSSGDHDLGRSALALSCQLSDAQHAVPGHPFTVALTTRVSPTGP